MSGLTGIYSNSMLGYETKKNLLNRMAQKITYSSSDKVEKWNDNTVSLARVHHGTVNPERQPLFNKEKSICIFMDGEVFDYEKEKRRLIEKGYIFNYLNNDAEFCLYLYEEYRDNAFEKLNGSFFIVIYELQTKELLFITDRVASRHGFYYIKGENLFFGSQLRPLLEFEKFPRELDLKSIYEFIGFQKIFENRTYYKGAKRFTQATIAKFRKGKVKMIRYWEPEYKSENYTESHYVDLLTEYLQKAVRSRVRGNKPVGLMLSGGLDSRAILAADKENKIETAFTLGDFRNREVKIAENIAKLKGCKHVFIKRHPDHYIKIIDDAIDISDGMHRFDHAHFLGFSDLFQKYCDTVLIGFAFNVIFRGHGILKKSFSIAGKSISLPVPLKILKSDKRHYDLWKKIPTEIVHCGVKDIMRKSDDVSFEEVFETALRQLQKINTNSKYFTYDCLAYNPISNLHANLNITSIQSHMEHRIIATDNDILETAYSMPPEMKINSRVFNKALKRLSPSMYRVADAGTTLPVGTSPWKKLLVDELLQKTGLRKKQKMPNPIYTNKSWPNRKELIRYNKTLRDLIWNTINDPECLNPEIFNIEKIKEVFQKHLERKKELHDVLLVILTFGRWHKKYGP